jgi:hypothetical protein
MLSVSYLTQSILAVTKFWQHDAIRRSEAAIYGSKAFKVAFNRCKSNATALLLTKRGTQPLGEFVGAAGIYGRNYGSIGDPS